jgi:hypothetical protein
LDELLAFAVGALIVADALDRPDPTGCSPTGLKILFEGTSSALAVPVVTDELLFVGSFEALDDDLSIADPSQSIFSCESLFVRAVIFDIASGAPKGRRRDNEGRV